ncbi:Ribosomal RNA large subunit methyltransferase A [Pseudoalteromonas luteoviolacea B = ATCC 29581]|nr:Ribosomal RNA large subunit methyltransferase A [Pseudoalteromonas luteoviolacea B = ATCC 29581]
MTTLYRCPLCSQPLKLREQGFQCDNNHLFDKAKEGYINLLPVQFKKSKEPGDNLDMVQARRAFLASGHYAFLQQSLSKIVSETDHGTVLDMGCGEGFYTQSLKFRTNQVYGIDISKAAVRYAAKRYKDCHFAVASCKQSPFEQASFDCIISVFAPFFGDEVYRLLNDGGTTIIVSPGPEHLIELKQMIYQDVKKHTLMTCPLQFKLLKQEVISKKVTLNAAEAKSLVLMTPFAWKFRPEHLAMLDSAATLPVTLEFALTVLKKPRAA